MLVGDTVDKGEFVNGVEFPFVLNCNVPVAGQAPLVVVVPPDVVVLGRGSVRYRSLNCLVAATAPMMCLPSLVAAIRSVGVATESASGLKTFDVVDCPLVVVVVVVGQ